MKRSASWNSNLKTFTSKFLHISIVTVTVTPASLLAHRKIKDIKQFTVDEGKKVNDSLKAYQIRYDQQLGELDQEMEDKFNTENEYQTNEYKRGNDRMQFLEDMLANERNGRIQSLNDQLNPICAQMNKNFADLEAEKNARVQKEREILDNLAEESAKIEEAIN